MEKLPVFEEKQFFSKFCFPHMLSHMFVDYQMRAVVKWLTDKSNFFSVFSFLIPDLKNCLIFFSQNLKFFHLHFNLVIMWQEIRAPLFCLTYIPRRIILGSWGPLSMFFVCIHKLISLMTNLLCLLATDWIFLEFEWC